MAKYARGKKSQAISDRSGLRVSYTQLKTTWDGLRVSPEDWEPKNPQLTPAKNVVDATALFNPRPDTDPENVEIFIGFNYDIFADRRLTTNVGISGKAFTGQISLGVSSNVSTGGVAGDGGVGDAEPSNNLIASGVSGIGGVSTDSASYLEYAITVGAIAAGNRYYVDSVLQQRLYLQEGQTYRFDQSASSNNGHPLRFSTTSNGTHAGGSQYTTGVTTSGTPGNAGAYTQITVASGAPTLYYYCTNHNYMGGTSYTPAAGTITLITTVVGGNPSNHPYHNVGSSNKYAIDGSTATSDVTLLLTEGSTYRFDQSASSNSGHPLRFSATANGTHAGGSEYTTGVTTSGTPGNAGAYTQIVVASGAPTLYYYCTNHSSMGWTAKTPELTSLSGDVPVELNEIATGVGGDGDVGGEIVQSIVAPNGVSGNGDVGDEIPVAHPTGVAGGGGAGAVGIEALEISIDEVGVGGTGSVGNPIYIADLQAGVAGVAGDGEVGSETQETNKIVTGLGGTGGVGTITTEVTKIATGVGGTGAVGDQSLVGSPVTNGAAGTGGVGNESIDILGWGNAGWGEDGWGE